MVCATIPLAAQEADYLSDRNSGIVLQIQQGWGDFGYDVATAATGGTGAPLQIGEQKYQRGLGHHANGEIVVPLRGRYTRFQAVVGVQWQGGNRGSVVFRVSVDGQVKFEAGPMSDSDPARPIDIPLAGARELRLVATDAGDGIGCDMANWGEARLDRDPRVPRIGQSAIFFGQEPAPPRSAAAGGFSLIAGEAGPQVAVMEVSRSWTVCVDQGEEVRWAIPIKSLSEPVGIMADVRLPQFGSAEVELSLAGKRTIQTVRDGEKITLTMEPAEIEGNSEIALTTRGTGAETAVRWSNLRYVLGGEEFPLALVYPPAAETMPPPLLPNMRASIEQELVEWDWRMQDGIGTERESRTWQEAIQTTLQRGDQLIDHFPASPDASASFLTLPLAALGREWDEVTGLVTQWQSLRARFDNMSAGVNTTDAAWEDFWLKTHRLRRQIALANPLADVGPLVFVKQVPSGFSHQLTQYAGHRARPGGGIFVLDNPGQSMQVRRLDHGLPMGSPMHLDVSWDGRRILFAFCATDPNATEWLANMDQFYHLYEISADGSGLRQLTDGQVDDFAPRYLPNGKILFISTRRGGFHRCGRGPCHVYTMATAEADGSNVRVISFHETHEWDPAVLNDGRIIYTRWDYVDRHAVHYQQLWSVRPDGSDVRIFYGNNTLNPVGVWEARPIPGSNRVMATAAAHHAMTAGSIILLDVTRGIDGLEPITRLTPDALFPESEARVERWYNPAGVAVPPEVPVEQLRWPNHCYRTPYPLSEDFFLATYSFDPLIGEPFANRPNMFGIYLVDRCGNKELLYRDASIGSLWPMPLRPRQSAPALPSMLAADPSEEGMFLLQDVYASWPIVSDSRDVVKSLRIVQVLPKTTPHANTPRVGLANASPGKQVLGTVPVEPDGSAFFRAPAGIPLAFQALDERGMAIQTMRSLTYLQPGEQTSCVGCHEHRTTAPAVQEAGLAAMREPSSIRPAPDGSKPFSYPILVQPVLDKHCVSCHGGEKTEGNIDLTGQPEGEFSRSYNALVRLVPFSAWQGTPQANHEPLTHPNQFGARASSLMPLLLEGHEDVKLPGEEYERLITWMDANALFYGTFDPEDQARQRRGERIAGPELE
jgi:cytochrome c553